MKTSEIKIQTNVPMASRPLITVTPNTRLEDALALMTKHQIHHLPVVEPDDGGKNQLVGLLEEREVLTAFIADNSARSLVVGHYMQSPVRTIDETTEVREALSRMLESHVSALPVFRGGELVGIVTETDMLRLLDALLRRSEPLESVVERGEAWLANPLLQNVLKVLSDSGI